MAVRTLENSTGRVVTRSTALVLISNLADRDQPRVRARTVPKDVLGSLGGDDRAAELEARSLEGDVLLESPSFVSEHQISLRERGFERRNRGKAVRTQDVRRS